MTMQRLSRVWFVIAACLWLVAGPLHAQDDPALSLAAIYPDITQWDQIANRAEAASLNGNASLLTLNRSRVDLFAWRDRFAANLSQNSGRITTLDAQIAALGAAPAEGVEEPAGVAARRTELTQKRDTLITPDALTAEAHARADGLLLEIDSMIRDRDASAMFERGPSPLNPAYWPAAATAVRDSLRNVTALTTAEAGSELRSGDFWQSLPLAIVYFVVSALVLNRSNIWANGLRQRTADLAPRSQSLISVLLSVAQLVAPMIGLIALIAGLRTLGLWTGQGAPLLQAIIAAGGVMIVARWLSNHLFPTGTGLGPLSYDADTRVIMRRAVTMLSFGVAAVPVLIALVRLTDTSETALSVLILPVQLVLAYLLFQLGALLRRPPTDDPLYAGSGGVVRRSVGQMTMLLAVASPVLLVLGFVVASTSLHRSVVLTLAIFGVVIVLQRMVFDIYAPPQDDDNDAKGPLMPVLIGFILLLAALPFLALAWGARVATLQEVWTRIATGFTVGETRITPADFMAFLLVFVALYLLTRFIQSTLRRNVMPRTRLDLGGQNAVIAGVGYVGIFLAALISITSAGIDLTSLAFVAGALSLGIGFGLQNIVQNFVSGIILLIERPIGEGDMIEVNGQVGFVRDISVRSTRIETFDRTDVIVPNADLVSNQVINWTRGNLVGRLILHVGVAYGSDVDKVRDILLDVASNHPMTLGDPAPQVFFMAFGESSLDFEVRVLLRDINWKVPTQSELNFEINSRLAAEGIEIPFPQRDLWLRNPETLTKAGDT